MKQKYKSNGLIKSIIIIIISLTVSILYCIVNINYSNTNIEITALNQKNDTSQSSEISILQVFINGENIIPNTIFSGWKTNENNELYWNEYEVGINNIKITGIIPEGRKRFIIFSSNQWKGKAQIKINGVSKIIDFYNTNDNGTYELEVKGEYKFGILIFLKSLAVFLETNLVLICFNILYKKANEFFIKSCKIDKYIYQLLDKRIYEIFMIVITILAIVVRLAVFSHTSGDYNNFLLPWYQQLNKNGIYGLKNTIGNYTEGYMLFLAILSYIPINPLYGIKLFSCSFDFFSAILISKLIFENCNNKNKKLFTVLGYTLSLLLPTIIFNSAYWAQCDSIYTFFVILSIYMYSKSNYLNMFISIGLALSFKLQAMFVIPVLLIIYYKKRLFSIWSFTIIPLIYIFISIPALLVGKPITEVLKTFLSYGSGTTAFLTGGFNNIYTLVLSNDSNVISYIKRIGVLIGIILVGSMALYFVIKIKELTLTAMIGMILAFVMVITYVFPGMHERYLYLADLISILWFIIVGDKKLWYIPIGINMFSLLNYTRYVTEVWPGNEYNILTELNAISSILYLFFLINALHVIYKNSIVIKLNEKG